MATEVDIQTLVHNLEEGKWAPWIKRAVTMMFVFFVFFLWMFKEGGNGFKGLMHPHAIEQAQISRELARGNGFSTKMIRPAAMWQIQQNTGKFPTENIPDTYHAPLSPWLTSLIFKWKPEKLEMTEKTIVYWGDKVVVGIQFAAFLLGALVTFFIIRRLFDEFLASLVGVLTLVCQRFWDFSFSGLPQMVLFLWFSLAIYLFVRAMDSQEEGGKWWGWLLGSGAMFGLMVLTHALAFWIVIGAAVFAALHFRIRWLAPLCILGVVMLFYTPWLIRNLGVTGNIAGLGWYSVLSDIRGTESMVMRSMEPPFQNFSPWAYREKLQGHTMEQMNTLWFLLGGVLGAPLFFVSLLHVFKRKGTSSLRWGLLLMWAVAVFGMSFFGLEANPQKMPFFLLCKSNDLHVLFIPLFCAYGFAWLLVTWGRLEIPFKILRTGFIVIICAVSVLPFVARFFDLFERPKSMVAWPPYVPPYIHKINEWTNEKEVTVSDIPWAVAWYADRKSLWLPMSIKEFITLNDYDQLGGKLVGLYLTPWSANRAFIADIAKGEYAAWSPFITRQVKDLSALRDFPLKEVTLMPIDGECLFYSDRNRWTPRED